MENVEIWKDVMGYEGLYRISSKGRIFSITKQIIKSLQINKKDGYTRVTLSKNSKHRSYPVHRLVAQAFLENPENKPTVNHIDGNKNNNFLENLEWATHREQVLHAIETGLLVPKRGENHHNSKLNNNSVKEIKDLLENTNKTQVEISNQFGVSKSQITNIKQRKSWVKKEINRDFTINKGSNNPQSKLTEDIVYNIKEKISQGVSRKKIQDEYNVSKTLVQLIATEESWSHVVHPNYKYKPKAKGYKLTENIVREIHKKRHLGYTQKMLQEEFNVSRTTIQKILYGTLWSEIYKEFN